MSQQVTVDYQGISIQAQAECDRAVHSLCQIDKVLEKIHKVANKLETSKVKEYEIYLQKSKNAIKKKIENFKNALEKYKETRAYMVDGQHSSYQQFIDFADKVQNESQDLIKIVNELTGSKLAIINQMIEVGLLNAGKATTQAMLDKLNGVVMISSNILSQINNIEDVSLRELAYKEILKNDKLSFDEVIIRAQEEYNILLGKQTKTVIQECKEELTKNGIDTKKLDNVKSIDEAYEITNESIVDENVRKETLKIIIKAIKDRGFIVDTKKNLKFNKEKNVLKLVALKASGQKAEFEIQLNGKFMYHFDKYEGHACKKDIKSFFEDLKNIYDINILHEEVIWENPDKIQTQKYQYINKNKGTN